MNTRKAILAASIAAALGLGAPAHAQQPDRDEATELDAITVTGIRGSIERSLDTKRDSESLVEVISAEDIGKMPDKNVADSLQRVAGVTISAASANEGAFDENDRVSMRGTSTSLTQTLINGHNIASGDWFVLNQTGTVGRSVSYSLLPSELVDTVMVYKTYQAKLVEGGSTGSIDIITRTPLGFAAGLTTQASIGAVYADLPGETDPQLSGLLNWRNDAGTVGFMVQAFNEKRHLRRDGQEVLGYDRIGADTAAGQARPDLVGVFYPVLIGSALFEQERERTGGLVTAEFKPTDDVKIGLTGFSSRLKADNYNRNYMLWGSRIIGGGGVPAPGYVVRDNTLVEATFPGVPGLPFGVYDQISRPGSESSTNFFSADLSWNVSDTLSFSGQAGTSRGRGKTPTQDVAEWDVGIGSGAGWRLNGVGAADWNLGTGNPAAPGTPLVDITLDWIFGFQDIDVKDREDWLRLDGTALLDGVVDSVDFGLRDARHERKLDRVTAQGPACLDGSGNVVPFDWGAQFFCPAGTQSPFDPANWPTGLTRYPNGFASGIGGNFPRNIWDFTPEQLAAYNRFTNRNPVERFYFPGAYGLEERSSAAYLQFNLRGAGWSGNVGLRYVRTQEEITNYVNADPADPAAITTSAFGAFKPLVTKHTYEDWLPTANLKFELSEDVQLRLAATRTLTRPDYSALAGAVSLMPPAVPGGVGSGSGGNPDLPPILSTNFDAAIEWYYAPRALFSAAVFRMDIDNYVSLGQVTKSYFTIDSNNPQGTFVDYVLTVPVASGARVNGVEFAWQQPFGEHFGAFANFTFADGKTDDRSPMLGTSKTTWNVGAYFENALFNARVNYSWREAFYSGLDRASAFYQDDVGYLSASLGWTINDNFMLTLDGRNLNNPKTRYFAESRERPRSIYENGRQYYLSLRMKF